MMSSSYLCSAYVRAMQITDKAEADEYLRSLARTHILLFSGANRNSSDKAVEPPTFEQAISIQRDNLWFFATNFGPETQERVERLFECFLSVPAPLLPQARFNNTRVGKTMHW